LNASPIYRTLGKTGIRLPIVSMGVMNADVPGLVRRSFEIGIRHFDTAAVYQQGRNEQMVGSVIKEMGVRDQVTISTKVASPGRSRDRQAQSAVYTPAEVQARVLEIFDGSLRRQEHDRRGAVLPPVRGVPRGLPARRGHPATDAVAHVRGAACQLFAGGETMAAIAGDKGLAACDDCDSCLAQCRNSVNIAMKIQHLKEISSIGRLRAKPQLQ
jgi:predicted aldo/keto reductase-like oxidoreductase